MTQELIASLKKLSGPDRKVDAAIWETVDPKAFALAKSNRYALTNRDWTPEEQERYALRTAKNYAPNYTGSTDAAMTMLPEGAGLRIERYWLSRGEAWLAVISTGGIPSNPARSFEAEDAPTPAIALCIASLKALAMKDNADE